MMRPLLLACTLAACTLPAPANAFDWVCSRPTANQRPRSAIERADILQAYTGQPVLIDGAWLLVVMLPTSHPDTRAAFADLGLSPDAAERLGSGAGLIDRNIRIVQTDAQMMDTITATPPAVGYVGYFPGGPSAALCF